MTSMQALDAERLFQTNYEGAWPLHIYATRYLGRKVSSRRFLEDSSRQPLESREPPEDMLDELDVTPVVRHRRFLDFWVHLTLFTLRLDRHRTRRFAREHEQITQGILGPLPFSRRLHVACSFNSRNQPPRCAVLQRSIITVLNRHRLHHRLIHLSQCKIYLRLALQPLSPRLQIIRPQ